MGLRQTIASCAIIAIGSTAGCRLRSSIWVVRGSNSDRLVLGIAEEPDGRTPADNLQSLYVTRCPSSAKPRTIVWEVIALDAPVRPAPLEVTYGVVPGGFSSPAGALPLTPGCYEVVAIGTGIAAGVQFVVRQDGAINPSQRGS